MNQLSILLVEDDPDDVELIRDAFKNAEIEYEMNILDQGNTVLSYLEVCKKLPNIIILDLNIPKLHGTEVIRILKNSEAFRGIPVVVLTTASSPRERDNCLNLGADRFVTKPSTIAGFNEAVNIIVAASSKSTGIDR